MSSLTRNIFFAVGLVAIVIMVLGFDVSFVELWQQLCAAGYWLLPIIGMWLPLYMLNALAWRVIILGSGPCPVSYWRLVKITVSAFALNYATPVGLLGGEPYKILEMKNDIGPERASSSVLLFAMMHVFSHIWYWLTAVALYIALLPVNVGEGMLLALVATFCVAVIYLFVKGYRDGMVIKLLHLLGRLPGCRAWAERYEQQNGRRLADIDHQIAALHAQNRVSFYTSFFLEYIGRVLQSFEIFFMLLLFGAADASAMTFVHAFIILAFTSLFANMLFFIPLQLGGREGGFAMSVANMGFSGQVSMSVSLLCRVRELFWVAVGMALIKVGNKDSR